MTIMPCREELVGWVLVVVATRSRGREHACLPALPRGQDADVVDRRAIRVDVVRVQGHLVKHTVVRLRLSKSPIGTTR
jgi:hypothetical protein